MKSKEELISEYLDFLSQQEILLNNKIDNLQSQLDIINISEILGKEYDNELLQYCLQNTNLDNFNLRKVDGKVVFRITSKVDSNEFYKKFTEYIVKKYEIDLEVFTGLVEKIK